MDQESGLNRSRASCLEGCYHDGTAANDDHDGCSHDEGVDELRAGVKERLRRFCLTTNVHGFGPLANFDEMSCFFRTVFLLFILAGITCAGYFIARETMAFVVATVQVTNDKEL